MSFPELTGFQGKDSLLQASDSSLNPMAITMSDEREAPSDFRGSRDRQLFLTL